MNKRTVLIVGGVVVVALVAGTANRFIGQSGGTVKTDANGNVTVKTDQGTWSSSDKLPSDFPTDVPVYPGATVQGSVVSSQQQGSGHFAGLETSDSVEEVVSWYKSEIVTNGWKIQTNVESGGSTMLDATKDSRELVVTITSDSGKTGISLVVAQK